MTGLVSALSHSVISTDKSLPGLIRVMLVPPPYKLPAVDEAHVEGVGEPGHHLAQQRRGRVEACVRVPLQSVVVPEGVVGEDGDHGLQLRLDKEQRLDYHLVNKIGEVRTAMKITFNSFEVSSHYHWDRIKV